MTLKELQTAVKKSKLNAYIVTRSNMFIGQDLLDDENPLRALTGFSGSAGTLVVTPDKAFLLVDGRYEIQAARQTNPDEVKIICGRNNLIAQCLTGLFGGKPAKVGFNSFTNAVRGIERLAERFPDIAFIPDTSQIFANNIFGRPCRVFEHKIEFCGVGRNEKIGGISSRIGSCGCDAYLFTAADSVSWLLNIRSDALPDTPLVHTYALLDKDGRITLFGDNLNFDFEPADFGVEPLAKLPRALKAYKNKTVGFDAETTPYFFRQLFAERKIAERPLEDFCQTAKAEKNPVEISGIEAAHLRDGVAMVRFLHWLSGNWPGKTELDVVKKLHDFRAQGENYWSESFGTIAAAGPDGAVVHYQPAAETDRKLEEGSLLLLDSGAQYFDGTTDITRTIALGTPSPEMCDNFTLVLKAHIALASQKFIDGTDGMSLDKIARSPMWNEGKDYKHGTGHGVGCFLNVHEGPQNIGMYSSSYPLRKNMILSVEPGYYQEGAYGIRIENLVRVAACEQTDFAKDFLEFKILTLCPVDKQPVNKYLMSSGEISWLNNYHKQVYERLSPFLNASEKNWLKDACSPL